MAPRLVTVGVPGDKRMTALSRAMSAAGQPPPVVVPWPAAARDSRCLASVGSEGDWLRIESPGSDAETWHALARRGGFESSVAHGEWHPGRAWFAGLRATMTALESAGAHLRPTHPAGGVCAMVDKLACHARLSSAGVSVPAAVAAANAPSGFRQALEEARISAVYVKPRWGSSGAGVMAYRRSGDRERMTTTARLDGNTVWNDKRLVTYTDRASIDRLLAMVLRDGAVVQRWVPKAGTEQGPFDMRVLIIGGHVAQRIARVGRGTITNLHLKSARLDFGTALQAFGSFAPARVDRVCLQAAECFPGQLIVAVDVMVDPRGRPFVLECNAWGDYLPGVMVGGLDSYDLEVRAMLRAAA